jgi:glyoxylase-like metal-dependent hydrolase (beta-lactamase superfamily II)
MRSDASEWTRLSRRRALTLAGSMGLLAATGMLPRAAQAQAAGAPNGGGFYRFRLGDFTLTLLSDGQAVGPLFPGWGGDPSRREVYTQFLRDHFLDPERYVNNFIPMLVQTGRNTILIDTGNGPGAISRGVGFASLHLGLAGVRPEQVDTIFITHGHADHIGGLTTTGGAPFFPNAKLYIGQPEFNFWTTQQTPSDPVKANMIGLKDRFTFVQPNQEIVPGLTAIPSPGHTGGHMSALITSGTSKLIHFGDAGGHVLLSLRFPEHYLAFDTDKPQVVRTRQEIFTRAADDRMLVVGYHFAWPGLGYLRKRESYFEFVAAPLTLS